MVQVPDEDKLREIEQIVLAHGPEGMTAPEIGKALPSPTPSRTLQFRIKTLVDQKRLFKESQRRWTRYVPPRVAEAVGAATGQSEAKAVAEVTVAIPFSRAATEIQKYVSQPVGARKPVGYDRAFLDSYRPNETFYLTAAERAHLHEVGTPPIAQQPAGTYAKQIISRLLIDLAWNSSRLEGNTYSLLDTRRLIDLGQEAQGKDRLEAQMSPMPFACSIAHSCAI